MSEKSSFFRPMRRRREWNSILKKKSQGTNKPPLTERRQGPKLKPSTPMENSTITTQLKQIDMDDLFGGGTAGEHLDRDPSHVVSRALAKIAQVGLRLEVTAHGLREATSQLNPANIVGHARLLLWLQKKMPSKLNRQVEAIARLKIVPPSSKSRMSATPAERVLAELDVVPLGRRYNGCIDVVDCCCCNLEKLGKHLRDLVVELDPAFNTWNDQNFYKGLARLHAFCTAFNAILRKQAILASTHLPFGAFECHAVIGEVILCAVRARARRAKRNSKRARK